MSTAILALLDVIDPARPADEQITTRWQNFWVDSVVDGYSYQSFDVSSILFNRSADEGGITISIAALQAHSNLFLDCIETKLLLQVRLYEMPVDTGIPDNLQNETMISSFLGQVISLSTDLTSLSVSVGSAIDAISGEIPGRRVTTSVVGRLPTL